MGLFDKNNIYIINSENKLTAFPADESTLLTMKASRVAASSSQPTELR